MCSSIRAHKRLSRDASNKYISNSDSRTMAGQPKQEPDFLVRSRRAAVCMAYVPTSLILCTLISEVVLSKSLFGENQLYCYNV